jgi:hypothetical protein
MASQDDQISDKRRRLFKALSAAPVVATLRPGEALANASLRQCISKNMGEAQSNFHLAGDRGDHECSVTDVNGCHVFDTRNHSGLFYLPDDPSSSFFVVDMQPLPDSKVNLEPQRARFWLVNNGTGEHYKIELSNEVDQRGRALATVEVDKVYRVKFTSDYMQNIICKPKNNKQCESDTKVSFDIDLEGIFVVFGEPNDDLTEWTFKGVWPDVEPSMMPNPDNDQMGGSCLHSFDDAVENFTLARG